MNVGIMGFRGRDRYGNFAKCTRSDSVIVRTGHMVVELRKRGVSQVSSTFLA